MSQVSFKDPDERVTLTFEFAADLGSTETIAGVPVITVALKAGPVDPAINTMIYAAANAIGSKVLVGIANGVAGNDYIIRCKVETSGSHTYVQSAWLPVRAA